MPRRIYLKRIILTNIIFILVICSVANSKELLVKENEIINYEQVAKYSSIELIILKYSIYARYGYNFQQKWLSDYFKKEKWYKPKNNFSYSDLSKIDYQNINTINKYYRLLVSKKTYGYKTKKRKYFVNLQINEQFPNYFLNEIKKNQEYLLGNNYPEYLYANPYNEAVIFNISNETKQVDPNDINLDSMSYCAKYNNKIYNQYYVVEYYDNGRIQSIVKWNCYANFAGNIKYYFNTEGKLFAFFVLGMGTSDFSELLIEYYNDQIVFMELSIGNGGELSNKPRDEWEKYIKRKIIY